VYGTASLHLCVRVRGKIPDLLPARTAAATTAVVVQTGLILIIIIIIIIIIVITTRAAVRTETHSGEGRKDRKLDRVKTNTFRFVDRRLPAIRTGLPHGTVSAVPVLSRAGEIFRANGRTKVHSPT
jgi:hypothetical protein